MRKFFEKLKRIFGKTRRQRFTAVAVFVSAGILLAVGVFAYFNSSDMVTNRFQSGLLSLAIAEPAWDETGKEKAKTSLPGMEIEKDPRGVNDGEGDMYVRIRVTIRTTDAAQDASKILQALSFQNVRLWNAAAENNSTNSSFWGVKDTKEKNSYLFYYCDTKNGNKMISVPPSGETAVLFDEVIIPKLKPEYKDTFDHNYTIELVAEGLPVTQFGEEAPIWSDFASKCGPQAGEEDGE